MKKHDHYDSILAYIKDVEGQTVLYKSEIGKWVIITEEPIWDKNYEYKVIPNKHLSFALAYLNEGAKIEWLSGNEWYFAKEPAFLSGRDYRIAPKPKVLYIGVGNTGLTTNAYKSKEDALSAVANKGGRRGWRIITVKETDGEKLV